KEFLIDVPEGKATALEMANGSARTDAAYQAVADRALAVLDELLAADDYGTTPRILRVAEAAAGEGHDPPGEGPVPARGRGVKTLRGEYEKVSRVVAALARDLKDAEGNRAAGRYHCFFKDDWDRGLPMLALAGDAALSDLAGQDLAAPTGAGEQADLADRWWALGQAETEPARTHLLGRAAHWYRQSLPSLTGPRRAAASGQFKLVAGKEEYRPGLVAELFQGTNFDKRVKARVDYDVHYRWGFARPDPEVAPTNFTVRWKGWLRAPRPGTYTLVTHIDDGARLWLDGKLVTDQGTADRPARRHTATVRLSGQPQPIQIDFVQGAGPW